MMIWMEDLKRKRYMKKPVWQKKYSKWLGPWSSQETNWWGDNDKNAVWHQPDQLMLSTLTLQEKHANDIDLGNTSDTGIKNTKNLIEVLEDGCKITCITCRRYVEAKQVEIRRY